MECIELNLPFPDQGQVVTFGLKPSFTSGMLHNLEFGIQVHTVRKVACVQL